MVKYFSIEFQCFAFLFEILDLSLKLESQLLYVFLSFFLKFFKLVIVLESGFFKIACLQRKLCFKLMYFSAIEFLETGEFVFQSVVFNWDVLILM